MQSHRDREYREFFPFSRFLSLSFFLFLSLLFRPELPPIYVYFEIFIVGSVYIYVYRVYTLSFVTSF